MNPSTHSRFTYQPSAYFLAVLISTTLLWGLGGYMSFTTRWVDYYMLPLLLGLMMPAVFAVVFIWRQKSQPMKQDFLYRVFSIRLIRPRVFIGSLLIMPFSVIMAILLSLALGGSAEQFQFSGAFSFSTGFVPVLALFLLAAVFEELGWRGYGFESLEKDRSFLKACIIFGILWSLWHLPLLAVNDSYQYKIYQQNPWFAANFFIGTALMGILVSWVCHINNRSILATIVFHFVINLSQEMFSMTQETKCLQTLVLAVITGIIIFVQKPLFLNKPSGPEFNQNPLPIK
ncbi:type II CAAX endopeptidase family protein [Marinospirillum perlucidum]|uniref:type II CAAX endopeptidase family protein n=1 Tax=Marinospirillum perlucidum TaxID=1982602 RepID=UPI000DF42E2A|nr:type II CAAX endopeptidase family protein [Marinospirillum perlucidum]